jgi:AsmA protein
MRNLKFVSGLAGAIAVLVCAALVGVWLFVNPNNYKGKIAAAVKESTGRELTLTGDIKLSVFPWIALELGPASLGNPPGFSDEPFLSFAHAALRVRLLPLLHQRLEVARVEVDGLELRLRKNPEGQGNWQAAEPHAEADAGHPVVARSLDAIANVRVKNGRVSYEGVTLGNLQFESGSATADHMIPVSLTFDAVRGIPREQIAVNAKFTASEDPASGQMQFAAVILNGTLTRPDDDRPVHWDVSAPELKVNLTKQWLAAPAFTLSYANAHVTGSAKASGILDDLSVTGSLTLAPLVLREFAPRFGVELPKTRDPKALSLLSATTEFAYDSKAIAFSKLQVHLDDTQIQGSVQRARENGAMRFELAADQIDFDRYRAPEAGAAEANASAPRDAAKSAKPLDASGALTVKTAHLARIDVSSLSIRLAAKDNLIRLFPLEAQIYGGRYSGDMTFDSRGAVPLVSVDEHLTGVNMVPLLANSAQKGRVSGRATLNLKATGRGATLQAVLKTLSGHLDANLADGALEGIDVGYELSRAQALIDRSSGPPRESTGHTKFQTFRTSAEITNGVAQTNDLTIDSQVLKVRGQGSANLSSKAIDFQLLASIATAPARNTDIPLKVTGTYADPTVRPDIEAVAKDQLKQKLQDVLKKNGLEGLFK